VIVTGSRIPQPNMTSTSPIRRNVQPVSFAARDYTACELVSGLDLDPTGATPNTCIGSGNSNHFGIGKNTYSVIGNQLLPPADGSSPPASFNSNRYIDLSREDQRYNAGFMAHMVNGVASGAPLSPPARQVIAFPYKSVGLRIRGQGGKSEFICSRDIDRRYLSTRPGLHQPTRLHGAPQTQKHGSCADSLRDREHGPATRPSCVGR